MQKVQISFVVNLFVLPINQVFFPINGSLMHLIRGWISVFRVDSGNYNHRDRERLCNKSIVWDL